MPLRPHWRCEVACLVERQETKRRGDSLIRSPAGDLAPPRTIVTGRSASNTCRIGFSHEQPTRARRPAPRRSTCPAGVRALSTHCRGRFTDRECIDAIRELEELKAAAAAAQARITAAFDASQRASRRTCAPSDAGGSVGQSPHRSGLPAASHRRAASSTSGSRARSFDDMPHTLAALTAGRINEFRAMLVVKETACLSRADRRTVDRELAARLDGAGDRRVGDLAREISQRLDPASAVRRARKAEGDRRVTVRPAPDTMSNLTALLPVTQGVAVYAALRREAERLRAEGDPRTIAQLMADLLVARTTGRTVEESSSKPRTPTVEIGLVMNERTLLRGSQQPAWIPGFGPIPRPWPDTSCARPTRSGSVGSSPHRRAESCRHGLPQATLPRQAPRADPLARPDLPHTWAATPLSATSIIRDPGPDEASATAQNAQGCARRATT